MQTRGLWFRRRIAAWAAVAIASVPGCLAHSPDASPRIDAGDEVAVMSVLDRFMDSLNALDMEGHVATYHFPHFRHAHGEIVVWQDAMEAMPVLAAPPEKRRAILRQALEPDWHRSEWTRREIVQAGPDKVHVATRFERLREDGSMIKAFDSLYVMTLETDAQGKRRWGIRGRSSYAP